MAKKTASLNYRDNNTVYITLVSMIAVFMLIIPFYRGLFFRPNYIPAIILICACFALFLLYRLRDKSFKIISTYLDITVALIPAAYLLSFLFAVNAKDAFDMFLLYCSYFMLYKLTSELAIKDEKYKNILVNVIMASVFILSFTAMLNIAGIIELKDAFINRRLYGLYQYANTSASVLGVGIVLSLNSLIKSGNTKSAIIYEMLLTSLISSFVITLSRGGFLVLAAILLLNFVLVKAREKVKMLLGLFIAFLSNAMFIYRFYALPEDALTTLWIQYLISLGISALLIYIAYSVKKLVKFEFSDKTINVSLFVAAAIFAGATVFVLTAKEPITYRVEHHASAAESKDYKAFRIYGLAPDSKYTVEFDVRSSVESPFSYGIGVRSIDSAEKQTDIFEFFGPTSSEFTNRRFDFTTLKDAQGIAVLLYNYENGSYTEYTNVTLRDANQKIVERMQKPRYVPEAIANRFSDISLKTQNVSLRVLFTRDGLKIIKDHLLTGAGGGAWRSLYRQYQSVPYNTTETHNFYVQYGIEVGIIGIAALIGLLVLLFLSMVKNIKAGGKYLHVHLAAFLLFVHSTIDFNLSLAAVAYILWLLIGLTNSEQSFPIHAKYNLKNVGALALILTVVILITASSIFYGMRLGFHAARSYKENKEAAQVIELYKRAAGFDRYNATYRIDMVQIMNNELRKEKNVKYYNEIMEQISSIRKYEPHNHQFTPTLCNTLLSLGKFEEASKLAASKLADEPLSELSYKIKIDVNYEIAQYYVRGNKIKEAVHYLEETVQAGKKLQEVNASIEEPLRLGEDYVKKMDAAAKTLHMIEADLKK